MRRYVIRLAAATRAASVRTIIPVRDVANVKSPCRKTYAGYLNRRLKSQLIAVRLAAFYPELHRGKHSPGQQVFNRSDARPGRKVAGRTRGRSELDFAESRAKFCVGH